MTNRSLKNLCLFHILTGLKEGLSHFSGRSRAALIFAENPEDPLRIYDPQDLLRGHEPILEDLYLCKEGWKSNACNTQVVNLAGEIYPEKNLELAGLISYGGRTDAIFYQMWFTEHHPNMCCIGPTERWLEHAATLLSHDFVYGDSFYAGTSGYALRQYAVHAVRDYVRDELNLILGWDAKIFIFPILEAMLEISKTPEEGTWPWGNIVFVKPEALKDLDFLVRFPRDEQPGLEKFKHVRKLLLTSEYSDRSLISLGSTVVGIARGELPEFRTTVDFRGDNGFLKIGENIVCSFSQGNVYSFNRQPNLVHLEEALLESHLDTSLSNDLFRIVSEIVLKATREGHGCTLVIDLNDPILEISGQRLKDPVDLRKRHFQELAKSMANMDGALHMGSDLRLHGFACLLDGLSVPGEDPARGARFNSALRFTAHHDNIIAVVVSADKPVSVIQNGRESTAQAEWKPFSKPVSPPPTLEEWLRG
jgi:hypothetical protein